MARRCPTALERWQEAEAFGPDFNGSPCMYLPNKPHKNGYVYVATEDKVRLAHRVLYEALREPIPEGLDLDHLCHNADLSCSGGGKCAHRACANPWHMEAVTNEVNVLRGSGPSAIHARKTVCKNGHEFVRGKKQRVCIVCLRASQARWMSKARARDPEKYKALYKAWWAKTGKHQRKRKSTNENHAGLPCPDGTGSNK